MIACYGYETGLLSIHYIIRSTSLSFITSYICSSVIVTKSKASLHFTVIPFSISSYYLPKVAYFANIRRLTPGTESVTDSWYLLSKPKNSAFRYLKVRHHIHSPFQWTVPSWTILNHSVPSHLVSLKSQFYIISPNFLELSWQHIQKLKNNGGKLAPFLRLFQVGYSSDIWYLLFTFWLL